MESGSNIIVVGASAGGVKALLRLVAALPADFDAPLFVALHMQADRPSILAELFSRRGPVPAAEAIDGEPIVPVRIYVAAPDHHLFVEAGMVRVIRGPKENGFRPSIDVLFRSAAQAYGPRAVGVVLTGDLADGAVGLHAIKRCGGVAIVQDPNEAAYPSMPREALNRVAVDACLPLDEIAPMLVRIAGEPLTFAGGHTVPDDIEIENQIAKQQLDTEQFLEAVEKIGTRSTYTCPECHGTLWTIRDNQLLRFRCHVGHAYSADALLSGQSLKVEDALWSAVRVLEEKVTLTREVAAQLRTSDSLDLAEQLEQCAHDLDIQVGLVRNVILDQNRTAIG